MSEARGLKRIRQERGIGVRRLAKGAPVSPRTVIAIEKGESTPQIQTIMKISRFLDVNPMHVAEFQAVLEAEGLDTSFDDNFDDGFDDEYYTFGEEDDDEPNYRVRSPESQTPDHMRDRRRAIAQLAQTMRHFGKWDVDAAYRQAFGEEPPR